MNAAVSETHFSSFDLSACRPTAPSALPPQCALAVLQQVGRAGRDGAHAECIMICSDTDFVRYSDDFYVGALTPKAREMVLASTASLRAYAADGSTCRHVQLLRYFGEEPTFTHCLNMCDNCLNSQKHANDTHRDFGAEARVVLVAVRQAGDGAPWSRIEPQLLGSDGALTQNVQHSAAALRAELRPRRSAAALREFLGLLVESKHLNRYTKRTTGQYARSYEAYGVSPLGDQALAEGVRLRLLLPVPAGIRQLEETAAARMEEHKAKLTAHGFIDKVEWHSVARTPPLVPPGLGCALATVDPLKLVIAHFSAPFFGLAGPARRAGPHW